MDNNNHAYQIIRSNNPLEKLSTDCDHEFGIYQDDKKWGVVTWYVCINCDGVTRNAVDVSEANERRQRKINYQTEHMGHPAGAKIEYGNPTMLGRDYEKN